MATKQKEKIQKAQQQAEKIVDVPGKLDQMELVEAHHAETLPSAAVNLFEEDAGKGQEEMKVSDYAIPRLYIMQKGSPQVDESAKEDYIEGAKVGMIFNTTTRELYNGAEGVYIVPASYRFAYIEWRDRESSGGGGIVKDHGGNSSVLNGCTKDKKGRDITKEGNIITPTAEYIVYLVDIKTGIFSPAVLSMASTQLKKSRTLNTMINSLLVESTTNKGKFYNPALFYSVFKLSTTPESNSKGTWMGWVITRHGDIVNVPNGSMIYLKARDLYKQINENKFNVKATDAQHYQQQEVDEDSPM
jgi:hypothetical protein